MIAFASSLDQGGPLAQTAEDAALLLGVMAGYDPKDSTSINQPVPDYTQSLNDDLQGLKIGLPKEYFGDGLDPAIAKSIDEMIKVLEKLGAKNFRSVCRTRTLALQFITCWLRLNVRQI